jgi:PAS domain S-box-containing protein
VYPSWWGTAFERLAAVSPARIVVLRWDGGDDATVEWANPAAAALVAVDPAEVAGRRVSELYPARYLDEVIDQLRRARAEGSLRYEVVRELPAGRRTLQASTLAIGGDRYVSFALDVTAEREAQRRLDQVTRLTGAGLYHWNVTTDEVTWTDEMFHLLGYEPGEVTPSAERYLDHVHPDDRQALEAATAGSRAGADAIDEVRHRLVRVDGSVRTVDVRAQSVGEPDGPLLYVLGVARDVTDEVEFQRHAELVRRAADHQRTALTLHDKVVQSLASVVLALDLDEVGTAKREALAAVEAAQRVVAELLADVAAVQGSIDPGSLRVVPTDPTHPTDPTDPPDPTAPAPG